MNILNNFIENITNLKNKIDGIVNNLDKTDSTINTMSQAILGSLSRIDSTTTDIKSTNKETHINGLNYRYINFTNDHDITADIKDRYYDTYDTNALPNVSSYGLELNNLISISAINHNNVMNSSCIIQNQTGEHFIKFKNNTSPNECLDLNTKTFWFEELLSDSIIEPHISKNSYYLNEGGAFAEIKIELETIRKANTITIKPMCKHPIYIRYIRYSHTDGINETQYDINIDNELLVGNDGVIIQVDTFVCKNLYIGINQVHYTYCDAEYKTTNSDYSELISNSKTGYLYNYGISYINITYKNYSNIAIYNTKEIASTSNINKLYIESQEEHKPLSDDNSVYTDTEYYVTLMDNPGINDWYSILPINNTIVECEKLFDLSGLCRFRFIASSVICIRQNSIELGTNEFILKSDYRGFYGVTIPNFNPNTTYTIKYIPIESSKYVEFNPSNRQITNSEVIKCNENNIYTLSAYPYNPTKANVEVDVLDTIKNKIYKQGESKVENTTGTNTFNLNKTKFQYYIDKNKIFFNQNMDERYIVNIKYKVVDSKYKLKVIMRRNTNKTMDITQRVKKIKVFTENY